MIQTGIENLLAEFVTRSYLASGVVTGAYEQAESMLSFVDALAGQSIAIRPGETVEGQTMPAVHVVCEQGEEDDIGNQTVTATVAIVFPCDPDTQIDSNLDRLNQETERIMSWLFDDDLGALAAALCTDSLGTSIVGVASRGSRRSFDGHLAVHELTLTLYCAGLNVY